MPGGNIRSNVWMTLITNEGLARVAEQREASADWSRLSISRRKACALHERDFTQFAVEIRQMVKQGDNPFAAPQLDELLMDYLSFKVEFTQAGSGRKGKGRIHMATLTYWRMILLHLINRKTPDGRVVLRNGLAQRLHQHCGYLVETYELDRHAADKHYFGRIELRILLEDLYMSFQDPYWTFQCATNWSLAFFSGCRPGSMGLCYTEWIASKKYFKLSDIRIFRVGYGYRFIFYFTILKGYNIGTGKVLKIIIRSVLKPENVDLDFSCHFFPMAFTRGILVGIKNVDDLEAYEGHEIYIKPECLHEPFFIEGSSRGGVVRAAAPIKPQTAKSMTEVLSRRGKRCGMSKATMYCFRRDAAQSLASTYGRDEAREGIAHNGFSRTMENNYLRGSAALDYAAARLGESSMSSEELYNEFRPAFQPAVLHASARRAALHTTQSTTANHARPQSSQKNTKKAKTDLLAQVEQSQQWKDYLASQAKDLSHRDSLRDQLKAQLGPIQSAGSTASLKTRVAQIQDNAEREKYENIHAQYLRISTLLDGRLRNYKNRLANTLFGPVNPPTAGLFGATITLAQHTEAIQNAAQPSLTIRAALGQGLHTGTPAEDADQLQIHAEPKNFKEVINVDDFFDTATMQIQADKGDDFTFGEDLLVSDVPLDEGPAATTSDVADVQNMRLQYIRYLCELSENAKDVRPETRVSCNICAIDPTVSSEFRQKTWTISARTRHQLIYHTAFQQVHRWWENGNGRHPETKKTCYLCFCDGLRFDLPSPSSLYRHIHVEKVHMCDPRTNDDSWRRETCKPLFVSSSLARVRVSPAAATLAKVTLPLAHPQHVRLPSVRPINATLRVKELLSSTHADAAAKKRLERVLRAGIVKYPILYTR